MDRRFEGKAAIVTGSSPGIGKATALRLAHEGAKVCVVADRNVEGGEATVREIAEIGEASLFVQADVSSAEDCDRIVEQAVAELGGVDILVNNAGITRGRPLEEFGEELWDQLMDTNLKSAFLMSQRVVPHMLAGRQGAVVNVSSVHAVATKHGHAAYAATKAGMCGLTRGLACDFGARGIRFNCILPGTIDTSLYRHRDQPVDPETWQPRANDAQVMKRCGSPDEIAAAICFLASDEASFVNGASLVVDGGLLCLLRDWHHADHPT